jgi:DNA polymerase sigma
MLSSYTRGSGGLRHGTSDKKRSLTMSWNLGSLLVEFFYLYGISFNYGDVGISIRDGGSYFQKDSRDWSNATGRYINTHNTAIAQCLYCVVWCDHILGYNTLLIAWLVFRPGVLCIENPDQPDLDMGRGSYNMPRIRRAFEHAHQVLLVALAPSLHDDAVPSVLAHIIRSDDPALASRAQSMKRNKDMPVSMGTYGVGSSNSVPVIVNSDSDSDNGDGKDATAAEQEVVWIDLDPEPSKPNSKVKPAQQTQVQEPSSSSSDSDSDSDSDNESEDEGDTSQGAKVSTGKERRMQQTIKQQKKADRQALKRQRQKKRKRGDYNTVSGSNIVSSASHAENVEPATKFIRKCPDEASGPTGKANKKSKKYNKKGKKNKQVIVLG